MSNLARFRAERKRGSARSFRLNCGPVIYRAFLAWPVPLDGWITRKVFRPGRLLVFTLRAATRSFLVRLARSISRDWVLQEGNVAMSIVSLRRRSALPYRSVNTIVSKGRFARTSLTRYSLFIPWSSFFRGWKRKGSRAIRLFVRILISNEFSKVAKFRIASWLCYDPWIFMFQEDV